MAEIIPETIATPAIRGTSILTQLGINPQDVLAAPNVASTLTAPLAPVTDALGIFTNQENALGIPGLKTAYQTAQGNFQNGQNLANQEQLTIQGRAKKLGVLRGEQQQAAGQANMDLQTLQTAQNLAGSALTSAQATAQQRGQILYNEYQQKNDLMLQNPGLKIDPFNDSMDTVSAKLKDYQVEKQRTDNVNNLITQTSGKAGIKVSDSAEVALQKADKYQKEEAKNIKESAEKDSYKKALRDLGLKTSGSRKELEKRLKKANKSALAEAKSRADQEWNMKVATFNKSMSSGSGSSGGSKELKAVASAFSANGGDWSKTSNTLANQGYDVSTGSTIDNELRRRNGLAPVGAGKGAVTAQKQLGDWVYFSDGTRENQVTGEIQQQQ